MVLRQLLFRLELGILLPVHTDDSFCALDLPGDGVLLRYLAASAKCIFLPLVHNIFNKSEADCTPSI